MSILLSVYMCADTRVKEWQGAVENMKKGRIARNPAGAPARARGYYGQLGISPTRSSEEQCVQSNVI